MSGAHGHSHVSADRSALFSGEGIKAIKVSTFGLLATALIQFVIVAIGGSVGLLADSLNCSLTVAPQSNFFMRCGATRAACGTPLPTSHFCSY